MTLGGVKTEECFSPFFSTSFQLSRASDVKFLTTSNPFFFFVLSTWLAPYNQNIRIPLKSFVP